ncbi:A24 family peptidase [Ruegeria lacuscaerulensis]|uniref:A24 family peptidase n=1 Tax=Ruegeria lacuscaerulensis TaxID=55218 RepID=UPI0014817E36|nr:prepilin peptidase [Ruegeria lacuscaerulensis]
MPQLDWQNWISLWLFAPLFVATAWTDFTQLRIPNLYCLIGLGLCLVAAPFLDWNTLLIRLLIGAACFVVCLGLFALNWLGGGDAKMLPVVFLAMPPSAVPLYMIVFSAAMALGLIGMSLFRRYAKRLSPKFESTAQSREFPMGVAIGASGLVMITLSVF